MSPEKNLKFLSPGQRQTKPDQRNKIKTFKSCIISNTALQSPQGFQCLCLIKAQRCCTGWGTGQEGLEGDHKVNISQNSRAKSVVPSRSQCIGLWPAETSLTMQKREFLLPFFFPWLYFFFLLPSPTSFNFSFSSPLSSFPPSFSFFPQSFSFGSGLQIWHCIK